jgi:hypothetical protein
MATVLEDCATERQRSVVRFLWTERLNAKNIFKEIFSVYVRKCLSPKGVVADVSLMTKRPKRK